MEKRQMIPVLCWLLGCLAAAGCQSLGHSGYNSPPPQWEADAPHFE